MSVQQKIRGRIKNKKPDGSETRQRRVVVFGDSHVHAIQEAVRHRKAKDEQVTVEARRLLKKKNGKSIGDTSFDDILEIARQLSEDDVLITVIGGNQHAVFSTIQHSQRFDFLIPGDDPEELSKEAEIIPFRTLYGYFASGIRSGDAKSIEALRRATRARVVQVLAPPPKGDNGFIKNYHDTRFAEENIASLGVSTPALRMKFWRLQNLIIEQLCDEVGVETLMPPAAGREADGFLARHCYANDATHANADYGELLLLQFEENFSPSHKRTKVRV
jgi:hypothetical protein